MRGAMVDVECPRCNAVSLPSAETRLATCAKCGLVFVPHELEHAPRVVPLREPPDFVTVTRTTGTVAISWALPRWPALPSLAAVVIFAVVLGPWATRSLPVALIVGVIVLVFGYLAALAMLDRQCVMIDPETISYRLAPIPFGRVRRVARGVVTGVRTLEASATESDIELRQVVLLLGDQRKPLLATQNVEAANYVRYAIATLLGVPYG